MISQFPVRSPSRSPPEVVPLVSATIAVQSPDQTQAAPPWSLATCIAFRFCFVYFGLYCISTQIVTALFSIPIYDLPDPSGITPWRQLITFTAMHLFHHTGPLVFISGSGDKTVDYALLVVLLTVAIFATALWSLIDRRRTSYSALYKWFFLVLRFCLAGQMLTYGFVKAVPLQMPFPDLFRLVEPYGDFSPMGVLWYSVGASPAYETFTGCLEIFGGLLLLFPRTITLGSLFCLADMTYVFTLNMTYDVPVKLLSFHLILLALFLLAPDLRRLAAFFLNRATAPAERAQLFRTPRANRIALIVQAVFAVWLVVLNIWGAREGWKLYGAGSPKPALYGIWEVEQFSTDGQLRPPLSTDADRWRRVIFEHFNSAEFQNMNDTASFYTATIDTAKSTLALTQRRGGSQKVDLTWTRPAPDQLILDGLIAGHKTHVQLRLHDRSKFLLVSRGFHWLQEYPFNH